MTKGRRAADRRRERQGKGSDDEVDDAGDSDDGGTKPGQVDPLPTDTGNAGEPGDDDLPMVSQVREIEPELPNPGTMPGRKRTSGTTTGNDPEASFVKAVRASTSERGRGDVTVSLPLPDRPPKRGGRLIVLEGPDQGGEADIELVPSLVGRTASAEVGLSDKAVSLRHLEIRCDDDGFALIDLGSTSGTLVNGRVVSDETRLHHGDVIALGKTELRFVRGDKLPAPRPEPAPPEVIPPPVEPTERLATRLTKGPTALRPAPKAPAPDPSIMRGKIRRATTRVIAASVVILGVAAAGKLVHDRFFTDAAPAQIRAQVAELLGDGRNRLRAQDVDGARAAAATVIALDPNNDDAKSLARMADTEAEARDAIALALRLGDEERDVEAGQILKRVPDASVFAPTRDRLRHTLDERGRLRSRRNVESLLDQGRAVEALAAAEKHTATWPDDEEGKLLLERARAAQAVTPKNPGLAEARAAFAAGDLDKARRIANDNGLKSYAHDVDTFQSSLAKGRASLSRFDDEAADQLDVAFRLLTVLGGDPSSPTFADVRKPYAKALLVAGTAELDQSPCSAARKLYKAARVTPDDAAVQSRLRELDDRAVAALDRAKAAKHTDADRAAATAREGLCLAKTGSHTYEELRALSRL